MVIAMRNLRRLLPVLLLTLLAGCTTTPSTPAPAGLTESGSFTIREGQVMRLAVGGAGEGTLIFRGWQQTFSIENMTLSGIDNNPIELEGTVYNLQQAGDFEGVFKPTQVDIEAGQGLTGMWTKNEKGVVAHVRSKGQSLKMQIDPTGAKVTLK